MWEWIFGVFLYVVMEKLELRLTEGETNVVVEVNGMDKIEDSDGKIDYMVDFLCQALPNLVSNIDLEIVIEMAKVSKAKVFSNYVVHNREIVHKDVASYWFDEATMVLFELDSLRYPFGKLPLTLVMMGNI